MRRRLIVVAGSVLALLIAGATTYKKWMPLLHKPADNRDTSTSQPAVMSVPPFATKEPESYQARRTITFTESVTNTGAAVNGASTTSVLIMRDGERRREEYQRGTSGAVVYLENSSSRFVLLPQAKLYAELGTEADAIDENDIPTETTGVSPDYLLHESPAAARYEKLGAENIGGRTTKKYRVTPAETNSTTRSETLIWIDDELGMPIKSETTHTDSDHTRRALMELVDIRREVDPKLFVLPLDYRKVAASQIFDMIRNAANREKPAQE